MEMVTYSDLFQLGILIVNIITLVVQINKKNEVTALVPQLSGYLVCN